MNVPHVLTVVAARAHGALDAALVAELRDAVNGGPIAILSEAEAADIPCPRPPDLGALRAGLGGRAVDLFATPAANRRKRLLLADMDSTIVENETLDELAAQAGFGEAVAAITARSMRGEIDFAAALRERVAMLRGLPLAALEHAWTAVRLMPGARTLVGTMRAHGARAALVSGGFTFFTERVAAACGFDTHRANRLLDDGAALSGAVAEPVLDRDAKLAALRELAGAGELTPEDALAIGDGANDLAMLGAAGLGIAFRAKPVVAASCANRIVHGDLRAALFAQGYGAGEFTEG